MVKRQMADSMQLLLQMIAAAQRSPPHSNAAPMVEDEPSVLQMLQQSTGSGSFRVGLPPQEVVPPYPTSPEEWNKRLKPILSKRVWTMGDMMTATLGYLSCQGINSMDLAHMVICKIRDMATNEYIPVFEGMVNSGNAASFWAELVVCGGMKFGRTVERRPFSAPRSFSPSAEPAKTVPAKKEKK